MSSLTAEERAVQPSNRLYHNDIANTEDGIETFINSREYESAVQRRLSVRFNSGWDESDQKLEDELLSEAEKGKLLLKEYRETVLKVEENLLKKWSESEDEVTRWIAEAAQNGDWAGLAI